MHLLRRRWLRLASLFLTLAMIAAACGGGSGGDEGAGGGDDTSSEAAPPTTSAEEKAEVEGKVAENEATGEDTREVDTGPTHGGRIVYGLEADSANPWAHYRVSCAISCRMILRGITDSLFTTDSSGELVPYLVEPGSLSSNDDLTEWSFSVREGISFHDGAPFDGEAVAMNIGACKLAPLTGPAFAFVSGVSYEGQDVTISYSQPDALGPTSLRTEVCGMMLAPDWLRVQPDYPLRDLTADSPFFDPKAADFAGDESQTSNPVGLGAFVFDSFTPGNGNSFIAVRNADYWRGDGANSVTGEGLPYLDEIEFTVAVDIASRSSSLDSGQFDIIHTANSDEIVKFRDRGDEFALLQANDFGETSHTLLNVSTGDFDPDGTNAESPLIHRSCRRALAHAIDRQRYADERGGGIVTPANGPFPPGSMGHLEDTGYPDFDIDAANAEMETCLSDMGGVDSIEFTFNTTNDSFNVESNQLIVSMWQDAFGDKVDATVAPVEQGQYIGLAIFGTFQAQGWRNHAGVDPSEQYYWWMSGAAGPIGGPALNFGRINDERIDAAYATILTSGDQAARKEAAEEVNRAFGDGVYHWWLNWTLWGVIANPRLQDLTDLSIPGGGTTFPVIAGKHHLTQIWCTDGDCQG